MRILATGEVKKYRRNPLFSKDERMHPSREAWSISERPVRSGEPESDDSRATPARA